MTFVEPRRIPLTLAAAALALLPAVAHVANAQVANDSCSAATTVPASGPFPWSTSEDTTIASNDVTGDPVFVCNTKFPGSTPPANAVTKSVWFKFTPQTTDTYQIDTFGSSPAGVYDTILGIYTGLCGNFTALAAGCGDDASGSYQSLVQVRLTAGTTYYIVVAAIGSRDISQHVTASPGGTLQLNVNRVAVSYPYTYVIPSVAHAQGATLYVSDLYLSNVDGVDGSFTVQFLNHGAFGQVTVPSPQPTMQPTTIRAGGSVLFQDVLANGFGLDVSTSPYGSLLIRSTVRLVTGARTYTTASGGGTFGQFALGFDTTTDLLSYGEKGRILGLRDNASGRTNIVLVNTSGVPCYVNLELRNANGDLVTSGQQTRGLPPNTMVQANGLRASLFPASEEVLNHSLKIENMTNGCTLGAMAYVIDGNTTPGTNDPYAVPMIK